MPVNVTREESAGGKPSERRRPHADDHVRAYNAAADYVREFEEPSGGSSEADTALLRRDLERLAEAVAEFVPGAAARP